MTAAARPGICVVVRPVIAVVAKAWTWLVASWAKSAVVSPEICVDASDARAVVVSPLITVVEMEAIWAAVRLDMATVLPLNALNRARAPQRLKF